MIATPEAVPQLICRWGAIAVMSLLITACQPEPALAPLPSLDERVNINTDSAPDAAETHRGTGEHGMAYATLRSHLLTSGWVPLPDAQCRTNVVGDNHAALCAADPQPCEPCEALPELSACSGTGHCTMQFQGIGGKTLKVSTFGDVHRRTAAGEPQDLVVTATEPATF